MSNIKIGRVRTPAEEDAYQEAFAKAQAEVAANFEAFQKLSFSESDKGKYALMKSGELVEIMDTRSDCRKLAKRIIKDGIFSMQQIDPKPGSLGFMGHALR